MKQFVGIAEAADALGASKPYIRSLVNGIRANTPDRYNVSDVFGRSKVSVRFVALQDYAAYGEDIGHAPPYRPIERERELGITAPAASAHDVAVELLRQIVKAAGRIEV